MTAQRFPPEQFCKGQLAKPASPVTHLAGGSAVVNYRLFKAINGLSGNGFVDAVMKASAQYVIYVVFAVLAVLCLLRLRQRAFRQVVCTLAALGVTFIVGLVGAAAYSEKRPFQTHRVHQLVAHAGGQSFPSDHTTAAFGIALAVLVFLSWRWGAALFLVAVLIGFARIYDGIHYPLDIVGAFVAAVIGVGLVFLINRHIRLGGPVERDRHPRIAGPAHADEVATD
jgi:undecaprenyl-diphosphatase